MRSKNPYVNDEYDVIKQSIFNENNSRSRCSIGKIVNINENPVTVDVQPLINYFDKLDGFQGNFILENIPIMQIANSAASFRFPLVAGNVGVILWFDREVFSWLASVEAGPVAPDSGNLINESACLFIPFLSKLSQAPSVKNLGVDLISSNVSLMTQLLNLTSSLSTFCTTVATATTTNPLTPAYSAQIAAAATALNVAVNNLTTALTTFKGEQ